MENEKTPSAAAGEINKNSEAWMNLFGAMLIAFEKIENEKMLERVTIALEKIAYFVEIGVDCR